MGDTPSSPRIRMPRFVRVVADKFLLLGAVSAMLFAFAFYANLSAERDALAFCNGIELGSDVSLAISRFERNEVHHYSFADEKGHSFIFHGFVMDRAYCDVLLSKDGKVISKRSELQHD